MTALFCRTKDPQVSLVAGARLGVCGPRFSYWTLLPVWWSWLCESVALISSLISSRIGADFYSLHSNIFSIKKAFAVSLGLQATFVLRGQACTVNLCHPFHLYRGETEGIQWTIFSDIHPENRCRVLNYKSRSAPWFWIRMQPGDKVLGLEIRLSYIRTGLPCGLVSSIH